MAEFKVNIADALKPKAQWKVRDSVSGKLLTIKQMGVLRMPVNGVVQECIRVLIPAHMELIADEDYFIGIMLQTEAITFPSKREAPAVMTESSIAGLGGMIARVKAMSNDELANVAKATGLKFKG